jgi:type III restriction enzyme
MKLKYDSNQQYQVDAIASVVDLFDGQPLDSGQLLEIIRTQVNAAAENHDQTYIELQEEIGAIGNNLVIGERMVLENLKRVQLKNGLPVSEELVDGLQFDIEMETGTGKTYVYLRTIFELAQKYGFTKFVILVPSVAIREGVNTSIKLMRDHFAQLYPSLNFDKSVYSGKDAEEVQSFATSTSVQIMVMTVASIKGDANSRIFHQTRDKLNGLKPVDFLKAVRPIVIMDEPQNMESDLSKSSIGDLNPAATLRYSATHKKIRNLVYQLDPIAAHDLELVKQIAVADVVQEGADATPYIKLLDVKGSPFKAKLELAARGADGSLNRRAVWAKQGQDLSRLTNNDAYIDNWRINEILLEPKSIELSNHGVMHAGEQIGGNQDAVYREMIRETIREHFRKENALGDKGIKVLSLFFVDKVAHYLGDGTSNDTADGKFVKWFDDIFEEEKQRFGDAVKQVFPLRAVDYRRAYFSEIKKGVFGDTKGNTKKDDDSYDLIMKDKARLLSENEPVRFIFSHSALREGWDNPNVFQICTLREMGKETERRQTIGRGLRLPVNRDGMRVSDRSVAQLTVVADESYNTFAKELQSEYEAAGVKIGVVRKEEFAKIPDPSTEGDVVGYIVSKLWWEDLHRKGFIDAKGHLTERFHPETLGFTLDLPAEQAWAEPFIIQKIKDLNIRRHVKSVRNRRTRRLNKEIYQSEAFAEFWESISRRTTYSVTVDRDKVIQKSLLNIAERDEVRPLRIQVTKAKLSMERGGACGQVVSQRSADLKGSYNLPDIISELQEATSLTRKTIIDILIGSQRLDEFLANPNDFVKLVKDCIQQALAEIVMRGVQYESIGGSVYTLRELQRDGVEEKKFFLDTMYKVKNQQKTDFDYVLYDSEIERDFASLLDSRDDVKLFTKLPPKFKIDTPVGPYNPDWAIVKNEDGEDRIYMVRETKSTADPNLLRPAERAKISAAKKHFAAIGINYAKSSPENWNV